ncbi:MAG: hypothetical protein H0U60_12690 [Blastocatellia bacterium]|nr:hypothetical protein [Blastocatellia bacterium]
MSDIYNEDGSPRVFVTDQMVDRLLDEDILSNNLKAAGSKYKGVSREEVRKLRIRAKKDLFFLCYAILGNNRLSPNLHGNLCAHIKRTENERFHEYLLARGNFKSTIITIGHSIQEVLPVEKEDLEYDGWWLTNEQKANDLTLGNLTWTASLGADCRLLIAHETHEGSARFLYAISSHFLTNPLLMGLFPEAVPSPRKQRVNKWELELPRTISGNPEPTVDTLGVGGKSQGRHYNRIKLDDIFGDKARDSQAEAETTIQWFDNIQAFFSLFSKDCLDLTGTRYAYDDVYAHAEEVYGSQLTIYKRKIEEFNPETGQTEITFPEEFTPLGLEILKKNKKVYNAQYLNDPDNAEAGFDKNTFRTFYWRGLNELITFDGTQRSTVHVRDLDVIILIDPGVGKSGGLLVTGMDLQQRVFILVALLLEMKTPQITELVFKLVQRWQPRTVAIESDLFAEVFEHWWKSEMRNRGIRFNIFPVYTRKRAKDARISGLEQYFDAGQIRHNEAQTDFVRELNTFGKSKNIHILDALAYGPEVWRPGYAPGSRGEDSVAQSTPPDTDYDTGYSPIEYEA